MHKGFRDLTSANWGVCFQSAEGLNDLFTANARYGAAITKYLREYDFKNPKSHPQFYLHNAQNLVQESGVKINEKGGNVVYEGEM